MYLIAPIGVEIGDGKFMPLFPGDTRIPASASSVFGTAVNDQAFMELHVLQGESPEVVKNRSLGRYRLEGLAKGPRGQVQFQVTFQISATGLLAVKAMDLITGYPITVAGPPDRIVYIK